MRSWQWRWSLGASGCTLRISPRKVTGRDSCGISLLKSLHRPAAHTLTPTFIFSLLKDLIAWSVWQQDCALSLDCAYMYNALSVLVVSSTQHVLILCLVRLLTDPGWEDGGVWGVEGNHAQQRCRASQNAQVRGKRWPECCESFQVLTLALSGVTAWCDRSWDDVQNFRSTELLWGNPFVWPTLANSWNS